MRLFSAGFQAIEATDGGAPSELHVPEVELPFFNCCRPQALTPPLRTTGIATSLSQKSRLHGQCHVLGVSQECKWSWKGVGKRWAPTGLYPMLKIEAFSQSSLMTNLYQIDTKLSQDSSFYYYVEVRYLRS